MLDIDKIYCMNCLKGMKNLEDKSVDLILTDPPYNISFKSGMRRLSKIKYINDWDKNFDITPFFNEMKRILSKNGCMYIFGRWDSIFPEKPDGCLIWNKQDMGMGDLKFWSMSYEFIFIFKNGRSNFTFDKRPTGMLNFYKLQNFKNEEVDPGSKITKDYMKHPTQKPVSLIKHILKFHKFNVCLDPFIGSGTTAVACKQLQRHFLGFEIDQKYVNVANKRLEQTTLYKLYKSDLNDHLP
jgi:site-specific DNA-methyltransferase (adenine-specific)